MRGEWTTESRGDWLRATAARAGSDAAYLTIGLGTSIVALVVWVTALSLSLSLVVFIVGLPVILGSAIAFRWLTELDRRNARLVLGRPIPARYRDHGGRPFLARLRSTLADAQTWRDLAWLVAHSLLGFAFGVVTVTLVGTVFGIALLPLWYWSLPYDAYVLPFIAGDTVWEALLTAPLAIPLALVTAVLLRCMALAHVAVAAALLGPR